MPNQPNIEILTVGKVPERGKPNLEFIPCPGGEDHIMQYSFGPIDFTENIVKGLVAITLRVDAWAFRCNRCKNIRPLADEYTEEMFKLALEALNNREKQLFSEMFPQES